MTELHLVIQSALPVYYTAAWFSLPDASIPQQLKAPDRRFSKWGEGINALAHVQICQVHKEGLQLFHKHCAFFRTFERLVVTSVSWTLIIAVVLGVLTLIINAYESLSVRQKQRMENHHHHHGPTSPTPLHLSHQSHNRQATKKENALTSVYWVNKQMSE